MNVAMERTIGSNTSRTGSIRLMKYLPPKWAMAMVERGSIRLGTLHDYRRQEELGDARGDSTEGTAVFHERVEQAMYSPTNPPSAFVGAMLQGAHLQASALDIRNSDFSMPASAPNVLIYCVSKGKSERVAREFGPACVEISDLHEFAKRVAKVVEQHLPGSWLRVADCIYTDERRVAPDAELDMNVVFLKPTRQAYQQEVRFAWYPRAGVEVHALTLEIPEVRELLTLSSDGDLGTLDQS